MRPWSANPRWVTAFDDFPLDSVDRKAELFAEAAAGGWLIALSHELKAPIGRLVPDRDRYRYEPSDRRSAASAAELQAARIVGGPGCVGVSGEIAAASERSRNAVASSAGIGRAKW